MHQTRPASRVRVPPGWAALLTLVLAGCATLHAPVSPAWTERRAELLAINDFQLSGRLAVATGSDGFSAGLDWIQHAADSQLQLRAPLGLSAGSIEYNAGTLTVHTAQAQLSGDAASAELEREFGMDPPLASFHYWLLGVGDPAGPADEQVDNQQRLVHLVQNGWHVDYSDYVESTGRWLPGKITLQSGTVRLKLVVNRWQVP
jgi:outer membrane lipoprotein LolB